MDENCDQARANRILVVSTRRVFLTCHPVHRYSLNHACTEISTGGRPRRKRRESDTAAAAMAPPNEISGEAASNGKAMPTAAGDTNAEGKPISTVVIIIAMQTEAMPLVGRLQLQEDAEPPFPKGVPWVRYRGIYKGLDVNIVWPGKDTLLGVDSVGTVSAALVAYASIQALKPDLIINAGTAGGFKAKGASIGDLYLASDVAFHDRRIPIPVFDQYGIGARKTCSTPNLIKALNLKHGKLSTGDSLDMSSQDEVTILANEATLKDMEGAAVAYVSDMLSIPSIFVKAVTDIVDGDKPTAEEFMQNLVAVTAALEEGVCQVVDFLPGKSVSQL